MSALDSDTIRIALQQVRYPGFSRDVVSLGVVKAIANDGGRVELQLQVESTDAELRSALEAATREQLSRVEGVEAIEIRFVGKSPARLPAAGKGVPAARSSAPPPSIATRVIGVASGKGGVGKSTVAVNVAVTLAQQGRRVGFLDADLHGPSAPLMFGLAGRKLERADPQGRPVPITACGVKVVSMGFLVDRDNAVIWRGPIVGNFIKQLLSEVAWGELDDLVIDFPPGTGDAQLTISQTLQLSGVVIVTTPNELALIDAVKACSMFRQVGVPILGLVENMAQFVCGHCGGATDVFGSGGAQREAERLEVPLLGRVPLDPAVVAESDSGVPVVISRPDCAASRVYRAVAGAVLDATPLGAAEPPAGVERFVEKFNR